MTFQPGEKVALQLPHRPDLLVLGRVQPDGQHVLWCEIVDSNGVESNRNAVGLRPGRPVSLKGTEQPCPLEFAHLVK
jgi:hypothetical protein